MLGGQVENVAPDSEVDGAIHTVVAHPTDPNTLYIGAVNGGIWKTTNATALRPNWERQTDFTRSNSIGALEFDPTDTRHRTLVAGIGLTSSFARIGGARTGLLKTTNGGNLWTPIDGGGTLLGKNISGVAARGDTIVVSVNIADSFTFGNIGIWRSTDGGASFSQVSGAPGSGLPQGTTFDMVGDPNDPSVLYTSVVFAQFLGLQNGVYKSVDTGATWTKVSTPAMDALLDQIPNTSGNVELAVGQSNNVFAAIVVSGRLAGVFRSGDGGGAWTGMDLPGTIEGGGVFFGAHPGGQGSIHLSIAADPSNSNVVYVGGDRQPFFSEGAPGSGGFFPNSIGAFNFSGRLFRGDASQASGSQWAHLTSSSALGAPGGGTASNSSPHADSREMVFDAAGSLIETDDGGIYRRTSAIDNTGDWFSLNGDLQVTEIHDHSYDALGDILISGNQDNGSTMQNIADQLPWFLWLSGDGGDTAVDEDTFGGLGFSIRYTSSQFLGNFNRSFWDANNNFAGFSFVGLQVLNGGSPLISQFATPIELNAVQPARLLIAGGNSLYESLDQGDTLLEVGPGIVAVGTGRDPIAYGTADNPDVIYSGNVDGIAVRTGPAGDPVVPKPSFPGTGSGFTIRDIVIDPSDSQTAYVINTVSVYVTRDAGDTWTEITSDLNGQALTPMRSIAYIPRPDDDDDDESNDSLVVGTSNGVFVARENQGFTKWKPLGTKMPVVPVFDLDYDAATDLLSAGTLGRGAFELPGLGTLDD